MKTSLTSLLIGVAIVATTSCNEQASLANKLSGSWVGTPERVETTDARTTTTITQSLSFALENGSKISGPVEASAQFTVESGTPLTATTVQPIAMTVSGVATISGKWEAIDDDEVAVRYDFSSMKVSVDPSDVVLEYNIATQSSAPVDSTLTPSMVAAIKASLERVFHNQIFNYAKIDDIKIKGPLMSCEINKRDFSFHGNK